MKEKTSHSSQRTVGNGLWLCLETQGEQGPPRVGALIQDSELRSSNSTVQVLTPTVPYWTQLISGLNILDII